MRIQSFKLTVLLGLTLAAHAGAQPVRLYVSPKGDNSLTGRSPALAYATLDRARDEIRKLKASNSLPRQGAEVQLLPGTYVLESPLELTEQDSGTEKAPIRYFAVEGDKVSLTGAKTLPISAFSTVTDAAVVDRLLPEVQGKVVELSIEEHKLQNAGPFPLVFEDSGGIFEVFIKGVRQPLSRWPNNDWARVKTVLVNGDKKGGVSTPGIFEYRDDRVSRWTRNPQLWLKGQWRVGWEDPAILVKKIDTEKRTVEFAEGISLGIGNKYTRPAGNGQEPWFAMNLLEEIDLPGEWAIEFPTKKFYLLPPEGTTEVVITQLKQPVVKATKASHISFQNISIEFSLGNGFALEAVDHFKIQGCTISNIAGTAVVLNGTNTVVQSCDMFYLGSGGVLASGGIEATLTSSNNRIINNHIHNYGVTRAMYSAAIDVGFGGFSNAKGQRDAVGMYVAHNLISEAPRDAILVSGQNHVFEFNEITGCGFKSADVGAFYSWLDWTIRGVIIRYNYMYDTVGGVNPDDGATGFTATGNIFVGDRTGVWIASGPDHIIENNIFVKDEGPVFGMDDRGVSRGYATNKKLWGKVERMNMTEGAWAAQFPGLADLLKNRPELPLRTTFRKNLIVMKTGKAVELKFRAENRDNPALLTQENNFITPEDPGFVDAANGNYELKPDSPVFKEIPGFEAIPFGKIGLMNDEFRKGPLPNLRRKSKADAPAESAPQLDQHRNFGT